MGLVLFEVPEIITKEIVSEIAGQRAFHDGKWNFHRGKSPANGGSSDVEWVGWTDFDDER